MRKAAQAALIVLIICGAGTALYFRHELDVENLAAWVAAFGVLGPVVFITARIFGAVCLMPGSLMGLAAGAAFGVLPGAIYNLVASTVGAIVAFVIARSIAPDWIHRHIRQGQRVDRLISGVEAEGWRFVAFVRLVPLFPYNFVNYAFGLTRISLRDYSLATLVCMIPADLAYVYMGYAAREALAGNEDAWRLGLSALGGLALLVILARLLLRFRRRVDAGAPPAA